MLEPNVQCFISDKFIQKNPIIAPNLEIVVKTTNDGKNWQDDDEEILMNWFDQRESSYNQLNTSDYSGILRKLC